MFPELSEGVSAVILLVFSSRYIVVELDFCVQSGGDVYSRAFLHSSHGTHRFPHGARSSRSNNQRTGEETPSWEPSIHTQTIISLVVYPAKVNRAASR